MADSLPLICLDSVQEEEIQWLYHPYIPRGKISLCAAYPGVGKTYLLCYMAACVSTGRQFFDVAPFTVEPENTIYLTTEDGLGDTIKQRLRVCGADMKRIFSVQEDRTALTFDNPVIENYIRQVNPALLIFDPFQSYIGENVELNAANKTRERLNHIAFLAEKYNVAVILVCQINKNAKGDAITRIIGSTDIVGIARSYLALGNVPEESGLKFMSHEKSSLAPRGKTKLFEINPDEGGIKALGENDLSMDDYIRQASENRRRAAPAVEAAKEFLKDQMPGGKRPAKELKNLAKANKISDRTLDRARKELGIVSKQEGFKGQYVWIFPESSSDTA